MADIEERASGTRVNALQQRLDCPVVRYSARAKRLSREMNLQKKIGLHHCRVAPCRLGNKLPNILYCNK